MKGGFQLAAQRLPRSPQPALDGALGDAEYLRDLRATPVVEVECFQQVRLWIG
jgi:hypothetical protein